MSTSKRARIEQFIVRTRRGVRLAMSLSSRLVGILLLVIGIVAIMIGYPTVHDALTWYNIVNDLYANAGTELISIAITVLIIDALNARRQRRQLREQLIRDMGGAVKDFSLRAVRELREYNWLSDGSLKDAYLWGANLEDANLEGAYLERAYLQDAHLQNANLRSAYLEGVYLLDANLEGADLRGAYLQNAILSGANLKGACLWRATLQGANLEDTNLQGADFHGANLEGAYLQGANLHSTNLDNVNLRQVKLEGAEYDNATNWPKGFIPSAGAINTDVPTR